MISPTQQIARCGCTIAVVMLEALLCGCSSHKPVASKPAPAALYPTAVRPQDSRALVVNQKTNSASVVAGGIVGFVQNSSGGYSLVSYPPMGINYTNNFPNMSMGDYAINGITWGNGYDGDVVVWVHTELVPFLMSQYYQWYLFGTNDLPSKAWVLIDTEDSFGSEDIRFDGGPWNPHYMFYKVVQDP